MQKGDPLVITAQVVVFGCEGLMYCGRKVEVSVDASSWSAVHSPSTFFEAWMFGEGIDHMTICTVRDG